MNKNKVSRYEAEESLAVEILLPNKYSESCEVEAGVKLLTIKDLPLKRLELTAKTILHIPQAAMVNVENTDRGILSALKR